MSRRRNGLRKNVTEAKEGLLSLGEKERQGKYTWGKGVGKGVSVLPREATSFCFSSFSAGAPITKDKVTREKHTEV